MKTYRLTESEVQSAIGLFLERTKGVKLPIFYEVKIQTTPPGSNIPGPRCTGATVKFTPPE